MRKPFSPAAVGALATVGSAFGFGIMPVFALYAYRGGMNVVTMLFIRFLLAAAVLLAVLRARKRGPLFAGLPVKEVLLLGLGYTLQSASYLGSVRYIPVSLATLILYCYPALVCLLSFLLERVRPNRLTVLALLLSFAGLVWLLSTNFGRLDVRGILLSAAAAVVYSLYITISNRALRQASALEMITAIALVSAACFLVMGLLTGSLRFGFRWSALPPMAGIVLAGTLGANLLFWLGLARLGPNRTAILSMTEPLFTILASTLLFGERLTLQQLVGGLVLLGGVGLVTAARAARRAAGSGLRKAR